MWATAWSYGFACVLVRFSETHIHKKRCESNVRTQGTHTHIQAHCLCDFYLTWYAGRVGASKADGSWQPRESSNGFCGCVRDHMFHQMLDVVHGLSKVFYCDAHAAAVLNCSMRLHDLMEHGVTLLGDLMTPRQPVISSPAPYFLPWRIRL
ncbi:putative syntaxin binding protein [Trypanosoma cruzi]|uniref:Putative syntaxin binding protein n=1 Tax=Trypanosoma cruzi TaxID=5693 RepID=A0A2V2X0E6_TRYCR|nr:putative syntaxin binding protein [Trypanosoma cruzi]PWV14227.1 putative syntaxin binding protein [Trypanosoma cruzi]RNC40641.1 putative syntaxin binding protein [Trypanosoma cruzi]